MLRSVGVDPTSRDRRKSTTGKREAASRVIGYVRVSTNEQTLGVAAQRTALHKWCVGHGARLVRVFTENGTSGAASFDKRPGLLGALAALRQLRAGVLLVAKRDRLARDTLVAAMVERLAARNGAVVRSVDGISEGVGPEALLLRRIVDAFAEYERLVIVARTFPRLRLPSESRGQDLGRGQV